MRTRDAFRQCCEPAPDPSLAQRRRVASKARVRQLLATLVLLPLFLLGSAVSSLLPDRSAPQAEAAEQRTEAQRQQLIDQAAYRTQLRLAREQGQREAYEAMRSEGRGEAFAQACIDAQRAGGGVAP